MEITHVLMSILGMKTIILSREIIVVKWFSVIFTLLV